MTPCKAHGPHQARHRAAGDIEALALQLPPDLANAVDAEVLLEDASDLDPSAPRPASPEPTAWRDRRRLATWSW